MLTTAVGSALWVVKLEEQKRIVEGVVEGLVAGAGEDDAPPVYVDDPV